MNNVQSCRYHGIVKFYSNTRKKSSVAKLACIGEDEHECESKKVKNNYEHLLNLGGIG